MSPAEVHELALQEGLIVLLSSHTKLLPRRRWCKTKLRLLKHYKCKAESALLARGPAHEAPTEHMDMEVMNRLSAFVTSVNN